MMKSTPGQVLERADVAALAADDPALHVVGRRARRRVTVVSAVWLAATRCSASATSARARRFASAAGLLLHLAHACGRARGGRGPRSARAAAAFASPSVIPDDPLELARARASRAALSSSWSCFRCDLAVGDPLLAPRELVELLRRSPPRAGRRAPRPWRSRRAGPGPRSRPPRAARTASSRASICASRRIVSASRSASATSCAPLLLAPPQPRGARGAQPDRRSPPPRPRVRPAAAIDREHAHSSRSGLAAADAAGCSHPDTACRRAPGTGRLRASRLGRRPSAGRATHAARAAVRWIDTSRSRIGRVRKYASVQVNRRMKHAYPSAPSARRPQRGRSSASSPKPFAAR